MLNKLLFHHFPSLKSVLMRILYDYLSTRVSDKDALFLNFGYVPFGHDEGKLALLPEEEGHRFSAQLYHHIGKFIPWENADVLEVSSGRGGGANFMMRHFKPRSYKGVDYSRQAVDFSRRRYHTEGLSFEYGNAEALTFADNSFDIVINLEASMYYPNIIRFFDHVRRVLKPKGYFLYADLRYEEKIEQWRTNLLDTGLKLIHEEEITDNVLEAIELDRQRRIRLVKAYTPAIMHFISYPLAGLQTNPPHEVIRRFDHRRYLFFILQKI
jgi:ubiquinone/menaquinone biosynthesis C-methylase UbiE